MKERSVTFVRIYLTEKSHQLDRLVEFMRNEWKVPGLTVLRGIKGYGDGGALHTAAFLDLSLDLPLVVEFFDEPERARLAAQDAIRRFDLKHVVCLAAAEWLDER